MTNIINSIFENFKTNQIIINENEFKFQYESHPNYPSLLAIVDTLTFFDIENSTFKADFNNIEILPDLFITLLNEGKREPELYLIKKTDTGYFYLKNNTFVKIAISELVSRWNGIVLLISESAIETNVVKKSKKTWVLLSLIFFAVFIQLPSSLEILFSKLFLILPSIGVFLSIAALKDLFGTSNQIINNLCNISASTSCTSVIKASKWKIFEYLNFSDLSITFFTSQFLVLLFSLLFNQALETLYFQKMILCFSIPFLFLSVYYQKFVEKKWCPICLLIILIILLELIVLQFLPFTTLIVFKQASYFGLIFLSCYIAWISLKLLLTEKKELSEKQLKSLRFERNYDLFKTKLLTTDKIDFPAKGVILGNENAKTSITIISNPFCGHCKEAHFILEKILEKNKDKLNVNIILRTNLESLDEDSKKLFRGLFMLFFNKGEKSFNDALKDWFISTDIKKWLNKYKTENNFEQIDELLLQHFNWTNQNEYTFTPAIFINGYEYPQVYDRKNLEFFINEILEDEF